MRRDAKAAGRLLSKSLCACGLLLSGCSQSIAPSEVVGGYRAETQATSERLVLQSSGVYTQWIDNKSDGQVLRASGNWHYDKQTQTVVFESGFLLHSSAALRPLSVPQTSENRVTLTACKVLGRVHIEEGDQVGYTHD